MSKSKQRSESRLNTLLVEMTRLLAKVKSMYESAQREYAAIQKLLEETINTKHLIMKELEKYEEEVIRMQAYTENALAKIDKKNEEIAALTQELEAWKDKITSLKTRKTQLKREVKKLELQLERLEQKSAGISKRRDTLRRHASELETENQQVQEQIEILEAKISESQSGKKSETARSTRSRSA